MHYAQIFAPLALAVFVVGCGQPEVTDAGGPSTLDTNASRLGETEGKSKTAKPSSSADTAEAPAAATTNKGKTEGESGSVKGDLHIVDAVADALGFSLDGNLDIKWKDDGKDDDEHERGGKKNGSPPAPSSGDDDDDIG